jgi:hypothetical protein
MRDIVYHAYHHKGDMRVEICASCHPFVTAGKAGRTPKDVWIVSSRSTRTYSSGATSNVKAKR